MITHVSQFKYIRISKLKGIWYMGEVIVPKFRDENTEDRVSNYIHIPLIAPKLRGLNNHI